MKVEATQSKQVEVELDDFTIKEIVISQFCNVFDIERKAYIKDGNLMYDKEYHTSHFWYDETVIREATEEDIAVIMVLKKLRKEL